MFWPYVPWSHERDWAFDLTAPAVPLQLVGMVARHRQPLRISAVRACRPGSARLSGCL